MLVKVIGRRKMEKNDTGQECARLHTYFTRPTTRTFSILLVKYVAGENIAKGDPTWSKPLQKGGYSLESEND